MSAVQFQLWILREILQLPSWSQSCNRRICPRTKTWPKESRSTCASILALPLSSLSPLQASLVKTIRLLVHSAKMLLMIHLNSSFSQFSKKERYVAIFIKSSKSWVKMVALHQTSEGQGLTYSLRQSPLSRSRTSTWTTITKKAVLRPQNRRFHSCQESQRTKTSRKTSTLSKKVRKSNWICSNLLWTTVKALSGPKSGSLMRGRRQRSFKTSRKCSPPEKSNLNLTVTKLMNLLKLKWEHLIWMTSILHHLPQQKRRIKFLARGLRTTESRNFSTSKLREFQLDSMQAKVRRMSRSHRYSTSFTTLTPSTLLKMAKARKGRERRSASSKFWGRNWGRTWCGPVKASSRWESNTRANSSWASNKSTSGGGTKPARDPRRLSENQSRSKKISTWK